MTTPTTTGVVNVTASRWAGGVRQGAPGWCFAAAEQIVQSAFGVTIDQAAFAHRVLMDRGEIGDPADGGSAITYYRGVQQIQAKNNLANCAWTTVARFVTADSNLKRIHENTYGQPRFDGRTAAQGGLLTEAQVMATIDGNGLVVTGNSIHYTVIYGYARDVKGNVTFKVYDPYRGTSNPSAASSSVCNTQAMQLSFRVTG
jgi:hypothetical protein